MGAGHCEAWVCVDQLVVITDKPGFPRRRAPHVGSQGHNLFVRIRAEPVPQRLASTVCTKQVMYGEPTWGERVTKLQPTERNLQCFR